MIRVRAVGDGFREELSILNHQDKPVELQVRIDAGSDFADLFEVKDALTKKGTYRNRIERGRLVLGYQRETYERATLISATKPADIDEGGLTFKARIEPHGQWTTELQVATDMGALEAALPDVQGRPSMARGLDKWVGKAPQLVSSAESLKATYQRSIVDLAALRFSPVIAAGDSLPAAGLPWFMTMFGRDSIFTSLHALPFMP